VQLRALTISNNVGVQHGREYTMKKENIGSTLVPTSLRESASYFRSRFMKLQGSELSRLPYTTAIPGAKWLLHWRIGKKIALKIDRTIFAAHMNHPGGSVVRKEG
jgi:hypothetical protein